MQLLIFQNKMKTQNTGVFLLTRRVKLQAWSPALAFVTSLKRGQPWESLRRQANHTSRNTADLAKWRWLMINLECRSKLSRWPSYCQPGQVALAIGKFTTSGQARWQTYCRSGQRPVMGQPLFFWLSRRPNWPPTGCRPLTNRRPLPMSHWERYPTKQDAFCNERWRHDNAMSLFILYDANREL